MIVQCLSTGEQHGLIGTLPNSVPFDDFKNMKTEHAEKMRKQKKEDSKVVKARYINRRGIHERLEKPYCKYAGDPIQLYKLVPEMVYSLPLGFINEVNESQGIPLRADLQSIDGKDVNNDGTPLQRDRYEKIHELVPVSF